MNTVSPWLFVSNNGKSDVVLPDISLTESPKAFIRFPYYYVSAELSYL